MTERKLVSGIVLVLVLGIIIVGSMQIWTRQNMQGILEVHRNSDDTPIVIHEIPLSDTRQVQVVVPVAYEGTLVEIVDEDGEVVSRGETRDRRNPIQVMLDQVAGSGLKYSVQLNANAPKNGLWLVRISSHDSRNFFWISFTSERVKHNSIGN